MPGSDKVKSGCDPCHQQREWRGEVTWRGQYSLDGASLGLDLTEHKKEEWIEKWGGGEGVGEGACCQSLRPESDPGTHKVGESRFCGM